ncbi:ABC transporter substrate-binding protein [Buttiauxella agrestis]|uniref:Uncharacterized protein n=1 Tax=Buttiauxella agrestis ATCC 33320 TaxID=1006004 RepID=A0A085G5P1_9ENTR|nr:ABC transporter substrate-binding protein [Buttiauxella agrestis]KFC79036.1 hypothetical protein GBAG_3164 [Buttiauxella agrestis ATCC 33320]
MYDSFVTTKVRPIRKLFIINSDDKTTFITIFNSLMHDIDGILNIILQVDEKLFSEINKEFVNRYDPDVILNYSTLDDNKLSEHFNTITYNSSSKNYNLHDFCSPLFTFTGTPYLATKDPSLIPKKVYASSKIEFSSKSLLYAMNFGVLDRKNYVRLKRITSIFQDVSFSCIENANIIKSILFDGNLKYLNLTNNIGSAYTSSTIYEQSYNNKRYFNEKGKQYLFISQPTNLNFIIYFWNTRNSYNLERLAWIPIDFLDDNNDIINENTILVFNDEKDKSDVVAKFPDNECIIADRYYFPGEKERWISFEHDQYLTGTSQVQALTHPNEKTFSDIGFGGGFIFEIRGPSELSYPKQHFLGTLFTDNLIDQATFPQYFTRLSNKGLSKYFKHFNPYKTSGITESFKLPLFKDLLKSHFLHYNLTIEQTPKTFILEQLIQLIGGINNTYLLSDERIFELLISLTPHTRTERLVKKAFPEIENHSSQDELISYIGTLKDRGEISLPSTVLTMENISSKLTGKSDPHNLYHEKLQILNNSKILLRGKHFKCNHCSAMLWFPLESFQRTNYCVECGNSIHIPIFIDGKIQNDHYKLNQLVSRAVDQGQLSTLLLINYINKQGYSHFNYETNYEIFESGRLISDIDVFVKIGKKLGLCECKSHSPFSNKQIDELLNTAKIIKCNFIILSCLLSKDDIMIKETVDYLKNIEINIPVFIITKDELFSEKPQRIYEYFKVENRTGEFYKGPVLIGNQ